MGFGSNVGLVPRSRPGQDLGMGRIRTAPPLQYSVPGSSESIITCHEGCAGGRLRDGDSGNLLRRMIRVIVVQECKFSAACIHHPCASSTMAQINIQQSWTVVGLASCNLNFPYRGLPSFNVLSFQASVEERAVSHAARVESRSFSPEHAAST